MRRNPRSLSSNPNAPIGLTVLSENALIARSSRPIRRP